VEVGGMAGFLILAVGKNRRSPGGSAVQQTASQRHPTGKAPPVPLAWERRTERRGTADSGSPGVAGGRLGGRLRGQRTKGALPGTRTKKYSPPRPPAGASWGIPL